MEEACRRRHLGKWVEPGSGAPRRESGCSLTIAEMLQDGSDTARLLGSREWEALRVVEGVPAPDRELTLDHNPLEAALWHTVSFDKGCYVGQETIARLKTYDGLKQQLWGLSFAGGAGAAAVEDAALLEAKLYVDRAAGGVAGEGGDDGESASAEAGRGDGKITSVLRMEGGGGQGEEVRCLAYVRVRSGAGLLGAAAGSAVTALGDGLPAQGIQGRLRDLPFASRSVSRGGF